MTDTDTHLAPNTLAFIALCNEYCQAVEQASETDRADFVDAMLRLLPRLYIAATDIPQSAIETEYVTADALDEDYYDAMRRGMEALFGADDTYLDAMEEDMRYSDTPIAASISEGLADIFQVAYNFVETVRDAPQSVIVEAVEAVREDFGQYWSRRLCNALRAINAIKYA